MNLAELKEAYKARKLALDSAKKEEEKYKALLKDAMLEAGESDYTDEAGYRFERIVQERKSMDEEKLLAELHERNLTSCIATKEVVDEDNKTLVEVGTYECHTAESSTTTAQLQPQKKNTTDLTLYTDPEAPIKRGDILYIYELDEYDKPIMSTEFKAIADKPYKKRTQLIVSLLSEEEV